MEIVAKAVQVDPGIFSKQVGAHLIAGHRVYLEPAHPGQPFVITGGVTVQVYPSRFSRHGAIHLAVMHGAQITFEQGWHCPSLTRILLS